MKIKNKKNKGFLFLLILSVSLFFGVNIKAAEVQTSCTATGGAWATDKCICQTGKVTNARGECADPIIDGNAYANDSSAAGPVAGDPGAGSASQGETLFGRTSPATPVKPASQTTKKFSYTLLESFPGFFAANTAMNTNSANDLPALILAIYKFGIWTVGIAGLFMLVVGGFMYMTSAGNTSSAGNARGIITDALLGIVAALGAYLILYVINPDFTTLNLSFTSVNIDSPIGLGGGGGKCVPVTTIDSPGTVAQLGAFGANATKASSICKIESGGNASLVSNMDKCQDGYSFSVGLFQINMIDSAPSICNSSGDIFTTGTSKGSCLGRDSNGNCNMWSCEVKDKAKYDACLAKLKDPAINVSLAKGISSGGTSWGRWGANKTCRF